MTQDGRCRIGRHRGWCDESARCFLCGVAGPRFEALGVMRWKNRNHESDADEKVVDWETIVICHVGEIAAGGSLASSPNLSSAVACWVSKGLRISALDTSIDRVAGARLTYKITDW